MEKYKFILTIPYEFEVDSQYEIDGHMAWPNWSQADPVFYKGIFNTEDEAKAYASEFKIYKYILKGECSYDSFEDEAGAGSECPKYYISIFDAEDAALNDVDNQDGYWIIVHPEYTVEMVMEEDIENEIPSGVYKYRLHHNGEDLLDSVEKYGEYYETFDDAERAAREASDEYNIETDESAFELETIEILNIEIVKIDDNKD